MKVTKIATEIVIKTDHIVCDRCGVKVKNLTETIKNPDADQSKIEEINSYGCDIKFSHSYDSSISRLIDHSEVEIDLCYDCSEFVKNLLRENGVKIEFPNYYIKY